MNERTCIVTRKSGAPDELIRFVVGPDSAVVPDLKRNLPGRGCWVTADRLHVDRAAAKKLFARAFKAEVGVPPDLGGMVDRLLARSALGTLGLARKAGAIALGAAKVESAVRVGQGLGGASRAPKLRTTASARSPRRGGRPRMRAALQIPAYKLFSEAELGLALGGTNVIHAAVLAGDAGKAALKRMVALDRYRGGTPDDQATCCGSCRRRTAAEDTE